MKTFYEFLKEIEKDIEKEKKANIETKTREDMRKMATQLKIMKEELVKAGFSEEFIEQMIIEAIKANGGV